MPTKQQRNLIALLTETLCACQDVHAAWLTGSLGRGRGDEWSDVDLLALASEGGTSGASQAIKAAIERDFEPVLLNELFGGRVLNVVTADWQRFDIAVGSPADLKRYSTSHVTELFNRSEHRIPDSDSSSYTPTAERIVELINEFLRVLGLSPVAAGRGEKQLMNWGLNLLLRQTAQLMIEENRIAPSDRGGALHLNSLLTAQQREELSSVPAGGNTTEEILDAQLSCARVFLPRARKMASRAGVTWPQAFEDATHNHLVKHFARGLK